jgi:uncharacterized protein (DUF697 family)
MSTFYAVARSRVGALFIRSSFAKSRVTRSAQVLSAQESTEEHSNVPLRASRYIRSPLAHRRLHMEITTVPRELEAERLVNGYVGWSAGASLIPIPGLDLAGIGVAQLKMLDDLAKMYGVPFSKNAAKSVIGALVGSGGSVLVAVPAASLLKIIPFVGHLAAVFTEPALAGAATWALGKVFIMHFESGGTFLDFDPDAMRKYFEEQYAAARAGTKAATPRPTT